MALKTMMTPRRFEYDGKIWKHNTEYDDDDDGNDDDDDDKDDDDV